MYKSKEGWAPHHWSAKYAAPMPAATPNPANPGRLWSVEEDVNVSVGD